MWQERWGCLRTTLLHLWKVEISPTRTCEQKLLSYCIPFLPFSHPSYHPSSEQIKHVLNHQQGIIIILGVIDVMSVTLCVCVCVCVCVCMLSPVWLFGTPWTIVYQAALSLEFSRQEYWSGLPFPTPGDLSDPGLESLVSPALSVDSVSLCHLGSPEDATIVSNNDCNHMKSIHVH